jgi:hypothetical protein
MRRVRLPSPRTPAKSLQERRSPRPYRRVPPASDARDHHDRSNDKCGVNLVDVELVLKQRMNRLQLRRQCLRGARLQDIEVEGDEKAQSSSKDDTNARPRSNVKFAVSQRSQSVPPTRRPAQGSARSRCGPRSPEARQPIHRQTTVAEEGLEPEAEHVERGQAGGDEADEPEELAQRVGETKAW